MVLLPSRVRKLQAQRELLPAKWRWTCARSTPTFPVSLPQEKVKLAALTPVAPSDAEAVREMEGKHEVKHGKGGVHREPSRAVHGCKVDYTMSSVGEVIRPKVCTANTHHELLARE